MYLVLYLVGTLGACFLAYRLGKRSVELGVRGPKHELTVGHGSGFRVGESESQLRAIPHPRIHGEPRLITVDVLPGVTLRQLQSKSKPGTLVEVIYYDGSHQDTEIPRDTFEVCSTGARISGEEFRKDWEVFYAGEEIPASIPNSDGPATVVHRLSKKPVPEKLISPLEEVSITDEQWKKLAEEYQFPLESQSIVDGVCTHLGVMRQVYNVIKGAYSTLGPGHRVWCRECRTTFTLPVIKAAEPSTQQTA